MPLCHSGGPGGLLQVYCRSLFAEDPPVTEGLLWRRGKVCRPEVHLGDVQGGRQGGVHRSCGARRAGRFLHGHQPHFGPRLTTGVCARGACTIHRRNEKCVCVIIHAPHIRVCVIGTLGIIFITMTDQKYNDHINFKMHKQMHILTQGIQCDYTPYMNRSNLLIKGLIGLLSRCT